MDFKDQIRQLSERVVKLKESTLTEEAAKTALVMPMIQCLGYDVFNPLEVVPEYVSDIGTKKGEKVDYAIMRENGEPCILIECKHWAQSLTLHDNQLLRYFHVTKARFGLLTNGVIYRFYTDLIEPNKMDQQPFLEINMADLKENLIEELKKFHKSYFDVDAIISTASDLKYTGELKALIQTELNAPSDVLVRYFAKQVYPGQLNARMMEYFTALVKKSFQLTVSDQITDRLKTALTHEQEPATTLATEAVILLPVEEKKDPTFVTTSEELEGFYIVRAILRQKVAPERIVHRDAQSYFAIFLDNNNRKPICRLNFNGVKKYVTTFDENKKDVRNEIQTLNDIFGIGDQLLKTVASYEKQEPEK